jgi:hypothetical protein
MYRLSKTHLVSAATRQRVEPNFGYGGNLLPALSRTSATPRLSLPEVPRWSRTPAHREQTPSSVRHHVDHSRRTSAPIAQFSNPGSPFPIDPALIEAPNATAMQLDQVEGRLRGQEARVAKYETKVERQRAQLDGHEVRLTARENDAEDHDARLEAHAESLTAHNSRLQHHDGQFQTLFTVLDGFRTILEEVNNSLRNMQAQNSQPELETPALTNFATSTYGIITLMKQAQSLARENEQVKAENNALKAKWDIVQSAMATAAGDATTGSGPTSSASGDHLGKRKRGSDVAQESPLPTPEAVTQSRFSLANYSSSRASNSQISGYFDDQSGQPSASSRNTTPEQLEQPAKAMTAPKSTSVGASTEPLMESTITHVEKRQRTSFLAQSTPASSAAARFALGDGSAPSAYRPIAAKLAAVVIQQPQEIQKPLQASNPVQEMAIDPRLFAQANNDDAPMMEDDMAQPENNQETANPGKALSDSAPAEDAQKSVAEADTVEFSDEEGAVEDIMQQDEVETQEPAETPDDAEPDEASEDASVASAPAKRTRSQTKASTDRRKTTGFDLPTEPKVIVPKPQGPARRHSVQLEPKQSVQFEHSTPETVGKELIESARPRGVIRQYKPRVTTLAKDLVEKELRDLGLEEWIDKDKSSAEYKKALEEARHCKKGSSAVPAQAENVALLTPTAPPSQLDKAFAEASKVTKALQEVTNEAGVRPNVSEKTVAQAKKAIGINEGKRSMTKKQRLEERRRNAELARAAMAMES